MIKITQNSATDLGKAATHAAAMVRLDVTAITGFSGIYLVESEAQPRNGQPGKIHRYTTVIREVANGEFETTCGCEAGTPTHVGQTERLCKHVFSALNAHKALEIAAINAKYAALGL